MRIGGEKCDAYIATANDIRLYGTYQTVGAIFWM